jgi:hypothetical protein
MSVLLILIEMARNRLGRPLRAQVSSRWVACCRVRDDEAAVRAADQDDRARDCHDISHRHRCAARRKGCRRNRSRAAVTVANGLQWSVCRVAGIAKKWVGCFRDVPDAGATGFYNRLVMALHASGFVAANIVQLSARPTSRQAGFDELPGRRQI